MGWLKKPFPKKVRCIETNELILRSNHIKYGEIYNVIDMIDDYISKPMYVIAFDNGFKGRVFTHRFEVYDESHVVSTPPKWAKAIETDPYINHRMKLQSQGIEINTPMKAKPIEKDTTHWVDPLDLLADDTGNKHDD